MAKNKQEKSRALRLIALVELFRLLNDEEQDQVIEKIKVLLSDE